MMIRSASCGVLASAMVLAAGSAPIPRTSEWPSTVQPLSSPAAPGSGQPQLSTSDRGVILSWIENGDGRATLKYAEKTPGGWSDARTVASGTDWFVNWADVPSVMRLADGSFVAHWLQHRNGDRGGYDVQLSHSKDGQAWSPAVVPHTDGTRSEHGFVSLFQMQGGGPGLVWLDGRAMTPAAGGGGHGDGAMSLRFGAFDAAWKQTAESAIALRVCDCCPTTAAVTSDGPIVAFRNRTQDEIRDIYISRLERGTWTEPTAVVNDGWKINACPVNGPMLSARNRDVAVAWFTVKEDQGRAFVAFSQDAGRTFGVPIRIDDAGALGRVDVELMADGSAVATWIEFAEQRAQFRARRVERSGVKSAPLAVATISGSRASGYPRLAAHGDELVFAWIESQAGSLRLQTASARLAATTGR